MKAIRLLFAIGTLLSPAICTPGLAVANILTHWSLPGTPPRTGAQRSSSLVTARGTEATYTVEEVRVSSLNSSGSALGLGGTLSRPVGAGPFAAVLLLADTSTPEQPAGADDLLNELADSLTRQRLAVLRLDGRGTGRSTTIPLANSSAELVADVQSALLFLRTRPGIDPMRVGVLGHGGGANVALLAAAQAPAPAFVVALGAAGVNGQELLARQTSLVNQPGEADTAQTAWTRKQAQAMATARREAKKQLAAGVPATQVQVRLAQEQLRLKTEGQKRSDVLFKRQFALLEIIRQTPDNAQAQAIVANMLKQQHPTLTAAQAQTRAGQLTSAWYRSFLAFNPQAQLGKVSCPTLLLHGEADAQVPTASNLPLLEKGLRANKRASILKLEGVNHNFQAVSSRQALAAGTAEPKLTASADALDTIREWVAQQVKP